MKKIIFSLVTVVALIAMVLPATSPPPVGAQPSAWPTTWTVLNTDPDEGGGKDHRDVVALYYDVDSQYIYLRMETVTAPGWNSTGSSDRARYKWWFNTNGTAASVSGTSVYNAEFLLILEDLTDNNNDPDTTRDQLGELTLMDDLNNDGFMNRWNSANPPSYTINNAQTAPTGNSSWWRRELGTGTTGVGGPQGAMGADIGYRIDNATTGGNFVDMYVSRAALGNPSSLCLIWATDNHNPNLDQAPNLDRPTEPDCIMLGKDYGDAPDPTYPTLLASDGARHAVDGIYLGATIDAELDGIPNSTATGDDSNNVDDEDGVVFTTPLVKGQSANVTVTASAAGKLDAWIDFNDDGDWGDAGEQIFTSQSLSAGANNLNFAVLFSATQTAQTFARFRFSSAGGLSYDGPADDGEVEDYQVEIEGCTLTVTLTGDTSFCEGSSTTITVNVTDGTPSYIYDWTASTAPGSAYNATYNATGSGTVAVTVTDDNGCTGSDSVTVTANEGPTADFSADVLDCCEPLSVNFTDESTKGSNDITEWYWDFGDGADSTDQNPSHIYDAGTYNITLTVTDSFGCSDNITKTEYITSNEGPEADFSADVLDCCEPLSVNFTDESTKGSNNITEWYWDFGDGTNSTDQNPSHIYDAGTYNVTLTVTDLHGCSDSETKINYITSNEGPTADFESDVRSCCEPLSVNFTDESTKGSNNITEWYWDFGDGTNSTLQNPSHIYDAGTYNITLTVTDLHGCSDNITKTEYITSNEGPEADFTADVRSCCEPLSVNFTDESTKGSNNITSWYWDFGDGTNSTEQHPSHIYDAGTYNVTLTVTDLHGCSDNITKTEYITSNEGPEADFSADVTKCSLTVNFTDESTKGSNNITSWYWDFDDGNNSTAEDPSHTYNAPGTYNVTLTVTDSHGCSDNETKAVTVYDRPTATASSNSPVPQGGTIQLTGGPDGMASYNWSGPGGWTSSLRNPTRTGATTAMAGTYILVVTNEQGCSDDATTNVVVIVPIIVRGGGGGCPDIKECTVDWDGLNTTQTLYNNDRLTADLLGPSPDGMHSLLLERYTHAPTIGERTYYLIVIRELDETPPLPENTVAIVAFNVTPEGAEFDKDIFLSLGLDQLPERALEETLTVAYYDDVNGVWVPMEYEPGEPDGVAELSLSTAINHFTIFAVLVEVAPSPPPPPAAHFVAGGLNIVTSVETGTFVTKTGESVTIAASIANDGGQEGAYTVELRLDGETVDTEIVTLGAGQSQQVSFTASGLDYGQHEVEVAELSGEFTTARTITWWLIIVIILAIGLIIWGVVWGRRRRQRAAQEG